MPPRIDAARRTHAPLKKEIRHARPNVPPVMVAAIAPSAERERTFMRRVATGELPKRLRNCVTGQLTENPERTPLGVLSFAASCGKGLGAAAGSVLVQRARRERSDSGPSRLPGRFPARFSGFLRPRGLTSKQQRCDRGAIGTFASGARPPRHLGRRCLTTFGSWTRSMPACPLGSTPAGTARSYASTYAVKAPWRDRNAAGEMELSTRLRTLPHVLWPGGPGYDDRGASGRRRVRGKDCVRLNGRLRPKPSELFSARASGHRACRPA